MTQQNQSSSSISFLSIACTSLKSRHLRFLVLLFICGISILNAQIILDDADWPYVEGQKAIYGVPRSSGPDTLEFSSTQPFFDDFHGPHTTPDTNKWYTPEFFFDVPHITRNMAIEPPSRGSVTFDGLARDGIPYATNGLINGEADRLFSHCIDLSGFGPANNIALSFALQPGGRGDAPDVSQSDSFFVFFKTPDPAPNDFIKVLAIPGAPNRPFRWYQIPLDDSRFFHSCFQLLFVARGSLSGALDHWHLDYVFLDANRASGDTIFQDQAVSQFLQTPFEPFSAIPYQHYVGANRMSPGQIDFSNLASGGVNGQVSVQIKDPVLGTPFNGNKEQTFSISINGQEHQLIDYLSFSEQNFEGVAAIELEADISSASDQTPENNTVSEIFPIDSIWAYDDGEADAVFGLNRARSFGVEINLSEPDSVSAVWISFVPTIYFNNINGELNYLEDHPFRLALWFAPNPDSTLATRTVQVAYGETPNHFERYAYLEPVPVSGTFWVGLRQTDNLPIGLGYDKNYDRDTYMYYDSLGNWTRTRLDGSFMIRVEMYHGGQYTIAGNDILESSLLEKAPRIYPNPSTDVRLGLEISAQQRITYRGVLIDPNGKEILEISGKDLVLPSNLKNGLYFWKHTYRNSAGRWVSSFQKWMYLGGN